MNSALNHTYQLAWNQEQQAWVPVAETKHRRGKSGRTGLSKKGVMGAIAAGATGMLFGIWGATAANAAGVDPGSLSSTALPTNGQVTHGSAQITQTGNALNIQQHSNKLIAQWDSFNIGQDAQVNFLQPSASSAALNRVLDNNPSQILGQLNANGQVFLINPNGIVFGQSAQVNVGSLIASTLDISNDDFINHDFSNPTSSLTFTTDGISRGSIENLGHIQANGGILALIGQQTNNQGSLINPQGEIALAAGNQVTLDFNGDGLTNITVDEGVLDALAQNGGLIQADGGLVIMTTQAKNDLYTNLVNNTGKIQAQTLQNKDGKILLLGGMQQGQMQVAGTLDASASEGGNGGFIETSAANVQIDNHLQVTTLADNGTTGTWLIDPTDFTVYSGAGEQTDSGIGATTLSNNLNTTSVILQTVATNNGTDKGDIHVNAEVSWNAGTTLTLQAHNDIYINASITAQHANGKVALQYGQASSDGVVNGVDANYVINRDKGAAINLQSGDNFSTQKGSTGSVIAYRVVNTAADLQAMNSNLSGHYAVGSNLDLGNITNWLPVGDNWSNDNDSRFTGHFDGLGHTLSNLTINRSNTPYVGLFGYTGTDSSIRHIGLVGANITGHSMVGALVGQNYGNISQAYSSGTVSGQRLVGGLVGQNHGSISQAYASGTVSGTGGISSDNAIGGLVGWNDMDGRISQSYATSRVSGPADVGGLTGGNSGNISQSYATGAVSGTDFVGGLTGGNYGNISQSYATGAVSGSYLVGGLAGANFSGDISNSYWDTQTTGQASSAGTLSATYAGKTTEEMQQAATYAGWDFSTTWHITALGNSAEGYGIYGLPTLQGVTPTSDITLFAGGYGTAANPFQISSWQQLANINHNSDVLSNNYHFVLSNALDSNSLGYNQYASATANSGAGWQPIGNVSSFSGTFDGNGHTLSNLFIDRSTDRVGLFGYTNTGSSIRHIGLVDVAITGRHYVGGLVGENWGNISNAYATGSVSGEYWVGGLVGENWGSISQAYATGAVSGNNRVGGLVGLSNHTISNAYATGAVTGTGPNVGGLVGEDWGTISNSYWDTQTTGQASSAGTLSATYAGKTTEEMQQAATYAGWDIATAGGSTAVWRIYEGHSGPLLRSFLTQVTVTADASSLANKTYDGSAASGTATYSTNLSAVTLDGSLNYATNSANAGLYRVANGSLILGGLYSGQQGYDISYADATLTINPKALTITGTTVADRQYDGSTTATVTTGTLSGLIGTETLTVSGTGSFNSKDAGSRSAAVTYSLTDGSGTASNYTLADTSGHTATIAQKTLTIASLTADNKVYDGGTDATFSNTQLSGLVEGEDLAFAATGTFADKNVGTGINVSVNTGSASLTDGTNGLASNYTLDASGMSATTTASITAKELTITGVTASDRVYDGSTTATLSSNGTLSGLVDGEDLNLSVADLQALFADKNADDGKTVTVTGYTLADGSQGSASNYVLSSAPVTTTANISKAEISAVTGITAQNRSYDGSTDATLVYSGAGFTGLIGSDELSVTGSGTFADKNAGEGKTVSITGLTLEGTDAGNYTLVNTTASTTATIYESKNEQVEVAPDVASIVMRQINAEQSRRDMPLDRVHQDERSKMPQLETLLTQNLITDNR